MTLYESAFAVVARLLGADYRRAIIVITLLGGLASTVFVPLTHLLVVSLGWRQALIALALIQLPFCAGIPFFLLRGRETFGRGSAAPDSAAAVSIRPALSHPVFWLLVVSFVSYAFLFTSLVFNLVPMLGERGYTAGGGRRRLRLHRPVPARRPPRSPDARALHQRDCRRIDRHAVSGAGAMILMMLDAHSPLVFVFAIAFGIGMGIKTIVQATAAPEFLGRAAYGALQGALMFPVYLAQALSPFLAAAIWQIDGEYDLLQILLLARRLSFCGRFHLRGILRPRG